MARPRQPIEVIQARGAKHLGKEEIKNRLEAELKPVSDNIIAPDYLNKKQKEEFYKYAAQLQRLKILGETDIDALARYVSANEMFIQAMKMLRRRDVKNDITQFEKWTNIYEKYYKIVRGCANDLGLTISSRCKLVVPGINKEEAPKENKFKKFEKA